MPGGTYFFTLMTYRRKPLLTGPDSRRILRESISQVRRMLPCQIDAWVLLPEHLHCIWMLPSGDKDFCKRWGLIKAGFSKRAGGLFRQIERINESKRKHRESIIWQRRFWEHQIRDQIDFNHHLDYIHFNPDNYLVECGGQGFGE